MSGIKYFTLEEMIGSSTAKKNGLANIPNWDEAANLRELVENVLDPLRELWGSAITVNSGYRCKELNKLVGGVSNSHHMYGYAADIAVGSATKNKELFNVLLNSGLQWTQAISESGCSWIHVSYIKDNLKNQILYT